MLLTTALTLGAPAAVLTADAEDTPKVTKGAAPHELIVEFDSSVLGRRVTTRVYRPTHLTPTTPVAYFLHGESLRGTPLEQATSLGLTNGSVPFTVVVPDAGDELWCSTCAWVDGRDGQGTAAARFLRTELVPTVEEALGIRADRDRRALAGWGMGATGAVLEGFAHPEVFGSVGALSPRLDLTNGRPAAAVQLGLLATQGYLPGTPEVQLRNLDPLERSPAAVNTGLETLVAVGSPQEEPDIVATADAVSAVWTGLGLAHSYLKAGPGESAADTFRSQLLPRLSRALATEHPLPTRVSYKSTAKDFTAWGYDVAVDRDNKEFLSILGARLDGRDFTLAGTGSALVTTPPAFRPRQTVRVVITPDPASDDPRPNGFLAPLRPTTQEVTADKAGRVTIEVPLGPARAVDETRALVSRGKFVSPHFRVEINPPAVPPDGPEKDARGPLFDDPAALPSTFSGWNVSVRTATDRNPAQSQQVLSVRFDSPVLGKARGLASVPTENYVYLPDSYATSDKPMPVVYWLHGTGGSGGANLLNFHELLDQLNVVVVALDIGKEVPGWCANCQWVDARAQKPGEVPGILPLIWPPLVDNTPGADTSQPPVMAESHLLDEVIPLMEELFRVRDDRAGRGITGNSMGGEGAFIQGFRHPDRFSFVGGVGPLLTTSDVTSDGAQVVSSLYLQWQGYPPLTTSEALYRGLSPSDLGANVAGLDLEVLATNGDDCMTGEGYCVKPNDVTSVNTGALYTEGAMRRANDIVSALWTQQGVAHSYATHRGQHGRPNNAVFAAHHLPRLRAAFAREAEEPALFSYKSTDRAFSVWEYDVTVNRPNTEFLHILGARLDGTDLTLAGTGQARVVTPARFPAHQPQRVLVSRPGEPDRVEVVRADSAGRLTFDLNLGPVRAVDETRQLVEAGQFGFPQTRLTVLGS